MVGETCVILYGQSVFLAGIQAELERGTGREYGAEIELVTVDPWQPDFIEIIRSRRPRTVLFDLTEALPEYAFMLLYSGQLLREQPSLQLIGVDPSSDEVVVLSMKPERACSVADLVNVIHSNELISQNDPGGIHEKQE